MSQAWNDYQTIQEQLGFERDNLSFYEENLQQSMISNEAGKIPDTEVRSAQLSLLSAEVSIARQEIELQQTYFQLLSIAYPMCNPSKLPGYPDQYQGSNGPDQW